MAFVIVIGSRWRTDRLQVITSPFNQNRVLLEETGQQGTQIFERRIPIA